MFANDLNGSITCRSLLSGQWQELAGSVSTACKTGRSVSAAILSFARWFGNGMSGVNLPFNGKYLSNLFGCPVLLPYQSFKSFPCMSGTESCRLEAGCGSATIDPFKTLLLNAVAVTHTYFYVRLLIIRVEKHAITFLHVI